MGHNDQPGEGGKEGADKGLDGVLYVQGPKRMPERAIISVKGGQNIGVAMIRDLKGVLDRENAPMGLFVTLVPPTKPMETEAAASGFWETDWGPVPRVQILTIEQLLSGAAPRIPMSRPDAYKKAKNEDRSSQGELGI